MVGKYHAGKQIGIVTHLIPLRKKFRVIPLYFRCFGKYRPKFKIRPTWSLCLKKNHKIKTNLHYVNQKTLKEKKKNEKKRNEQKYLYSQKKNRIKKFETQNMRRGTNALVLVEDT